MKFSYFAIFRSYLKLKFWQLFKVKESRYIALFVVSGSVKKLFAVDYVNICLFSIFFFNRFCQVEKFGVIPHGSYRDSLALVNHGISSVW